VSPRIWDKALRNAVSPSVVDGQWLAISIGKHHTEDVGQCDRGTFGSHGEAIFDAPDGGEHSLRERPFERTSAVDAKCRHELIGAATNGVWREEHVWPLDRISQHGSDLVFHLAGDTFRIDRDPPMTRIEQDVAVMQVPVQQADSPFSGREACESVLRIADEHSRNVEIVVSTVRSTSTPHFWAQKVSRA
jgi:hypothetical protein